MNSVQSQGEAFVGHPGNMITVSKDPIIQAILLVFDLYLGLYVLFFLLELKV